MPQFFTKSSNVSERTVLITDKSDLKHITTVLRLSQNDELILIDENQFTYKTKITEISSQSITAEILEKRLSEKTLKTHITLAQSIIKSNAQDIVIQKATELGAKEVIPLITRYTVVKLQSPKDVEQKLQRWQKIAFESCKQCERADIPVISRVLTIDKLINIKNDYDIIFACVERNAELTIKQFLKEHAQSHSKILVIIGPEGGWSDNELKIFKDNKIAQVSLGNLILRAETASIKALSDIVYEFELN